MNVLTKTVLLTGITTMLATGFSSGDETAAFRLDAAALEAKGQLVHLKFDGKKDAIGLDDRVLIEDDAPGNGPPEGFDVKEMAWFEKLVPGIKIKKEIMLDAPGALAGYLMIDGVEHENNETPLHLSINGVTFDRLATKYVYPRAEHFYLVNENNYFTDNWLVVEIPPGALKAGKNDIVLWADDAEAAWQVVVAAESEFTRGSLTRQHHPNRSAKSRDDGATWDYDKLGWKDALDGEYAIRLSLDRYAPAGTYVSPVIDLAEEPAAAAHIKRLLTIERSTVSWNIERPEGSAAIVSVRTGTTPVPSAGDWSKPQKVNGDTMTLTRPAGRYLQFTVEMTTSEPLATPVLKGVGVETVFRSNPAKTNIVTHITDMTNGTVVRPSYPFTHEDFMAMKTFRERFKLDELTAGCLTEFEKQLALLRFAYEIPIDRFDPYHWSYIDVPVLKLDENGEVMRQKNYEGRRRDKHCLFSNFTLMGACIAMGYPARYVNLQTEGRMHAHEVIEVWSNDFGKWVFMDATRDYYCYDPETGIPLSLTEINERIAPVIPRVTDWYDPIWKQTPDYSVYLKTAIGFREGDNKFEVKDVKHGPHLLMLKGQLHQVLRSDFATHPEIVPWRVSGHWAGNQFMGWYSETFPRKREYAITTSRTQDFNPPLNQAELTLSETAHPGVLRIDIDTATPWFDAFVISTDGSKMLDMKGASFEWPLHEGLNKLSVRAKNNVGVMGPESTVVVVMNK